MTIGQGSRRGTTVTGRIKEIEQPRGGYIKPSSFDKIQIDDGIELGNENISPQMMGLVVDYLSRFTLGYTVEESFDISIKGALGQGRFKECFAIMNGIRGLDDDSIVDACRMTLYDSFFRAGVRITVEPMDLHVDHETCENIRIMVKRVQSVVDRFGHIVKIGPTFSGGYTEIVRAGDADLVSEDILWDLKVSKNGLTKEQTLQLVMYYLMGKHSEDKCFEDVTKVGVINPRLNVVYILDMCTVPEEIINTISRDVIGY